MTEKVAFLFLTRGEHHNISIWESYFKNADLTKYKILVHPKDPATLVSSLWQHPNSCILRSIPTTWGTISLVKATLCLLQMAITDPLVKKFVLVSESCIPTGSFDSMYECICQEVNKSRIQWTYGKNHDRYHFIKGNISQVIPIANWMKQSQWMCLDRKHVSLLFLPANQKRLLKSLDDFTHCPAADEHFFINYFVHFLKIHPAEIINYPITYVDWNVSSKHPKLFGFIPSELLTYCREKKIFFARKFAPIKLSIEEISSVIQLEQLIVTRNRAKDIVEKEESIIGKPLQQKEECIVEKPVQQKEESIVEKPLQQKEEVEKDVPEIHLPVLVMSSMDKTKQTILDYISNTAKQLSDQIETLPPVKIKLLQRIIETDTGEMGSLLTTYLYMEQLAASS